MAGMANGYCVWQPGNGGRACVVSAAAAISAITKPASIVAITMTVAAVLAIDQLLCVFGQYYR